MKYFVALAGNMGVGKSSLTTQLAQRLDWEPVFEKADDNPYLADFYQDAAQWSFHSQMFFLTCRLHNSRILFESSNSLVQDRSIYEDGEIFAYNLYQKGYMSERDWQLYSNLYDGLVHLLPIPQAVIYLRASVSTLMQRIKQRGCGYELNISQRYLAELNELYENWADNFKLCPVLPIDTDNRDFIHRDEDLEWLVQKITTLIRLENLKHLS